MGEGGRIEFLFDYVSPFTFLGWTNMRVLAERRRLDVILEPVVFGVMLDRWGQRGPAEIPPKREFIFRQVARSAALAGIRMEGPKTHPFNSLTALRMSLAEVS